MARSPIVKAFPVDQSSEDYTKGPMIANNVGGISGGGYRVPVDVIKWENIDWRIAFDAGAGVLYVLAGRECVEGWRPALERMAKCIGEYGGVKNVKAELAKSPTGTVTPRIETKNPMPKPSDKRLSLNAITQSVRDAIDLGATPTEIRLAVFSAMGLDSEAA